MPAPDSRKTYRYLGLLLLAIWGALFVSGALGEILGVDFLRDLADFRHGFLR